MLSRFWTWLFRSQTLQFLLIVLLIVLAAVFVAVLVSKSLEACVLESLGLEEDAKYEALKFLGISMGGVLIALQALMSYKRAKAMEKTAQSQADAVLKTEQGQRQDRLKNAIEHLGHKSDSVRLGGAYELFHLAQDTPDTPELRQTVHDILCAHIRQTTGEKEYQEKHESNPSEEVQSLLNLLFVQEPDVFKGLSADLQGSWLKGVALERARLENATLVGVQLQRADLRVVQLQGADLSEAKMQEATLQGVQLQGADLSEAKMQEATLQGVQLQGADLSEAKMQEATLQGVQLQGADLSETQMQGAILSGVQLQGATLRGVKMQGAMLLGVRMQGVDLSNSELQGATLQAVQLQGARLQGVKMQGITTGNDGSFEERIKRQIYQESKLTGVTFEGKLSQGVVDSIVADFSDGEDEAEREILREILRERLMPHVGKPPSNQLPEGSGAITGAYTEEDAEKWISEYNKAMSFVPKKAGN
ncbi:MAG: pentapeptide repeat-containing protein [Gemmatimonadetes bacterium]|nr:pentapeptide repeat-containing protein [Gemmatimonadota bacterium]